jgi:hypothetical protein
MAHGDFQPEVATDLNKSGTLCSYMGQIDEARSLLAQAIDLREKLLGKEHPYAIQSRQGLEYLQQHPTQSPEAWVPYGHGDRLALTEFSLHSGQFR